MRRVLVALGLGSLVAIAVHIARGDPGAEGWVSVEEANEALRDARRTR